MVCAYPTPERNSVAKQAMANLMSGRRLQLKPLLTFIRDTLFERSLFVHRHFGQLRWLYQFLFLFGRVEGSAGRRYQMCSYEDDEIALNMLVGIGAEKSSY